LVEHLAFNQGVAGSKMEKYFSVESPVRSIYLKFMRKKW